MSDGGALEADLDCRELAELLDRALALVPPGTRAALVLRYVEDSPRAEIAGRLAMSEGAVAMRLQRGKLALPGAAYDRAALLARSPQSRDNVQWKCGVIPHAPATQRPYAVAGV